MTQLHGIRVFGTLAVSLVLLSCGSSTTTVDSGELIGQATKGLEQASSIHMLGTLPGYNNGSGDNGSSVVDVHIVPGALEGTWQMGGGTPRDVVLIGTTLYSQSSFSALCEQGQAGWELSQLTNFTAVAKNSGLNSAEGASLAGVTRLNGQSVDDVVVGDTHFYIAAQEPPYLLRVSEHTPQEGHLGNFDIDFTIGDYNAPLSVTPPPSFASKSNVPTENTPATPTAC